MGDDLEWCRSVGARDDDGVVHAVHPITLRHAAGGWWMKACQSENTYRKHEDRHRFTTEPTTCLVCIIWGARIR